MNFKETIEWNVFSDIWNFLKKYYFVQDDDAFWKNCFEDANALYEKYGNSKFAKDLILTVLDELERRAKELKTDADVAV